MTSEMFKFNVYKQWENQKRKNGQESVKKLLTILENKSAEIFDES